MQSISASIEGSVREKAAGWQARSPVLELALVLVRCDHVASRIVNANLPEPWETHPELRRNTNNMAAV